MDISSVYNAMYCYFIICDTICVTHYSNEVLCRNLNVRHFFLVIYTNDPFASGLLLIDLFALKTM